MGPQIGACAALVVALRALLGTIAHKLSLPPVDRYVPLAPRRAIMGFCRW